MRKIFFAVITAFCLLTNISAQRIKGSDTMLPLSQKEAEGFMESNPSHVVTVTGGGSGVGITALLEGTTDIAQLSRKIKFDEIQKLQENGKEASEVIAAYDALAVIVHPSNKVTRLTREQLEGIFRGKIKNWKDVGGEDMRIIPYARETSSGTYEFFRDRVLNHKNYMSGIMSMPATGAIIQSVGQTKGAIGYVGLAYLSKRIKPVHISYDNGKTFIEPSAANVKAGSYPVVRPLYYYYLAGNETVKPFLNFLLSEKGLSIVSEIGFIPVE